MSRWGWMGAIYNGMSQVRHADVNRWGRSGLAGGLRIQKRSLQPGSNWTTVQTVGTGFESEVGLSGEAAIYRVVK